MFFQVIYVKTTLVSFHCNNYKFKKKKNRETYQLKSEFLMKSRKFNQSIHWIRRRQWQATRLQYFCLENPMDGGAWQAAVHGVAKSQTRQSDFTFTFHFHALEKEVATHSSVLAWRIPGMGEPGGVPPMGSHRVLHD